MNLKPIYQSRASINRIFQEKQLNYIGWTLLFLSGILQLIFSLSHTIALRKLLLLATFLMAFKYFRDAFSNKQQPIRRVIIVFLLLQVWMLVIAGFVSDQPSASFFEWIGQWLPVVIAFIVGIGLANALMKSKLTDPRVIVVMSILVPITTFLLINAIVVAHEWIIAGRFLPSLGGIGDHHGISGYLVALIEPILIADMFASFVKGRRILPFPVWVTYALLIFAIYSLLATTNRNGILTMVLALVICAAMMISEIRKAFSPRRVVTFAISMLIAIFAIAFVAFKTDSRWHSFIETVPIAWDIDRDLVWLNDDGSEVPLTPSGEKIDISEYYRIAWAHEGWRMLMAHPWGTEIARDTFHKLVLEKYGHTTIPHSHNSWIDLGLEIGLPGLILWGWVLWTMAQFGRRAWRKYKDPLGVALAVLVVMFAIRGLLDSIFRDHELEQFMLVAGLLFGVLAFRKTNISQI